MNNEQKALTGEYQTWTTKNGLPQISADELRAETDKITGDQKVWLDDFIERWETADNE